MIRKTRFYSKVKGKMPKGCQFCVKGQKLVLFITGLCPNRCYFCPLSEKKFGKDVVFADEWMIKDPDDPVELVKEAEFIGAKGAGITGGDPLTRIDRCIKYIKLLKKRFGKKFHIHLYTTLTLVNKRILKRLFDAGLDEIRFHPDLDNKKLWPRLKLAKAFDWDVGIEIPCIPGKEKQIKDLFDFAEGFVDFVNLNELEFSDTKVKHYDLSKFKKRNNLSYAVKGSEELADKLLLYAEKKGFSVHFCSARLKDSVQLRQRIKRRAKSVARKFDFVSDDGTILHGIIYGSPKKAKQLLLKNKVPRSLFEKEDDAVVTAVSVVYEFRDKFKKAGLKPAIIEQYPTQDKTVVEVVFL
ncbi:radical SAM protein [Candidatus Woesearchaeota archaeon]|nr:MAG: radical SAM protein [Candidatus Woesearchaeota archaeon ex4484_78]RLE46489.1 MAG: radical SAM protein [Candidatus Woesearchaeota archaeon]